MSGGVSATTVAAYAALAAAAVGTYTAIEQGKQAKEQKDYQAAQAQADADGAASQAELEAGQIRKAAAKQRSTARAALADSGVSVDEGSAELIQSDIEQKGEEDALTTIYSGTTKARQLRAQAQGLTIAGDNAQSGSYFKAGASALSGFSSAAGWKTKTTTPGAK
jgi:hypothetical protein